MQAALEIMLFGMGGIFAAIIIIIAVTYLLKLMDKKSTKKEQ